MWLKAIIEWWESLLNQKQFLLQIFHQKGHLYERQGDFKKMDNACQRMGTCVCTVYGLLWGKLCSLTADGDSVSKSLRFIRMGISGENKKQRRFFSCFLSPFYSTVCIGSLLSGDLFGCNFSIVKILAAIAFTKFIFSVPLFWIHVI